MCKTSFPSKLLVDADAWQFWGKNETYILYVHAPSCSKNVPASLLYAGFK